MRVRPPIRAFIQLHELLATHKDLAAEIEKLKGEPQNQGKQIRQVLAMIQKLLVPPEPSTRRIGSRTDNDEK